MYWTMSSSESTKSWYVMRISPRRSNTKNLRFLLASVKKILYPTNRQVKINDSLTNSLHARIGGLNAHVCSLGWKQMSPPINSSFHEDVSWKNWAVLRSPDARSSYPKSGSHRNVGLSTTNDIPSTTWHRNVTWTSSCSFNCGLTRTAGQTLTNRIFHSRASLTLTYVSDERTRPTCPKRMEPLQTVREHRPTSLGVHQKGPPSELQSHR